MFRLKSTILGSSAIALTLALTAGAAGTRPGLSEDQRRAELTAVYRSLGNDRELTRLEAELVGDRTAPELRREYLTRLPLSPVDLMKIDMDERVYEVSIPKYIHDWHLEWVLLHQAAARRLYGDGYVDALLAAGEKGAEGSPEEAEPEAEGAELAGRGLVLFPQVRTNRNVGATVATVPWDYQGEIQLAANPNAPLQVVAAANTWDTMGGTCGGGIQAVFYSSDGGATWGYTCAPGASAYPSLGGCSGTVYGSDPALAWDNSGQVFLNYMLICSGAPTNNGIAMVVARSTDAGKTWSGKGVIKDSWGSDAFEDKNFYAIDINSGSPFFGRHYTCWDRDNNEKFALSTNGGGSWLEVDLPTPSGGGLDLGCDLAVEKDGTVHVIFNSLTGCSPCTGEKMFYTRSLDGGITWSTPKLLRTFSLVGFSGSNFPPAQNSRGISGFGAIDVDNSGGACDGNLYVTFSDRPGASATTADVFMIRSTNGGVNWSSAVTVNDDGLANSTQFHPFLEVDQTSGNPYVAWHDTRNDSANRAVEIFVARSTDCGVSVDANFKVSRGSSEFDNDTLTTMNHNSSSNPNFNPNQYGEYLGLDVHNHRASVAWSDTRHYYTSAQFTSSFDQRENLGFGAIDFAYNPAPNSYISLAAEDGWVGELTELSDVGAWTDPGSPIYVGDLNDAQAKGFVSFDTDSIPDTATITSAVLRLRRQGMMGNPFATLGALYADVSLGGFSADPALQASDFESLASLIAACTLTQPAQTGLWAECKISPSFISKTARTQFRVRFGNTDDDDNANDFIRFFGSDDADPSNRPRLIVRYQ